MAGSLASINIKFFADLKQFSTQMQNSQRQLKKMGKQLTATGKKLTLGLTVPLTAFAAVSVKTFADFEQEMAKVKAISGATESEFKKLTASALELGRTTRYTSSQVAALQLNFSKLGFKPDEIEAVTAATLDLALATGSDLAQSATVAASTLRGFGLEANEMQRVVDVMALSFSSSALDLEKFSTSMGTLAPVAKNAGVSIEQATSYLSILVDRGVDATTAGTGLRNIFLDLAGSGQTLESAMNEIATSTNKNKIAFELFGKRGATVAAIMADNSDEADALATSYKGAAGAAKRMADIMDNTLQGSLFKLKSASEGLAISFGEVLAPYVTALAKKLSNLAGWFTNLSPATKKVIVVVGALVAAIGPLLVALGFLMTTVVPGLITAFTFLSTTVLPAVVTGFNSLTTAMLANPIALVAAGIGLLVERFTAMIQKITPAVSKLKTFFNLIRAGGNHALFVNLQMEDQVAAMVEQSKAAEASAKATAEFNKQQKEAADLAKKLSESLNKKQGGKATGRKKVTPVETETSGINPLQDLPENIKSSTELAGEYLEQFKTKLTDFQLAAVEIGYAVGDAFYDLGNNIVDSLGLADSGFQGFVKGLFATITKLIAMMLASSISQSIAGATASGAATGPAAIFTTPAFIATAVGGVLSAFAAIPKFSTGGIVGGTSIYGDKILAGVNSGELILNTDQQKTLYGQLTSSKTVEYVPYILESKMQGSHMKMVLKRQDKIDNRTK